MYSIFSSRIVSMLFLFICLAVTSYSADVYVSKTTGSDLTGDGTIGNPWESINQAVTSTPGSSSESINIHIAVGVYEEFIQLSGYQSLLGSYNTDFSARDLEDRENPIFSTIIESGELHLGEIEDETLVISGLIVQNWHGIKGGSIYSEFKSLATIEYNTIRNNVNSGIQYCDGLISHNIITGNSDSFGAGVRECQGTILENDISGNSAVNNSSFGGDGGGLSYCGGKVIGNTITGNNAEGIGGGLHRCNGHIIGNTISSNAAGNGTAIADCDGLIIDNLISENYRIVSGSGNVAAIISCNGQIINCTISNNCTTSFYGGIHWFDGIMVNCIIWGNSSETGGANILGDTYPKYCCIEGWDQGGEGNITELPGFVDPAAGNFSLQSNSPCIDAGVQSYYMGGYLSDINGNLRISGVSPDMGCYEYDSLPDSDGDLLADVDEGGWSCDPNSNDTDGDGLLDGIEVIRGTTLPGVFNPTPPGLSVPADAGSIQEAIFFSFPSEIITVSPGTYHENLFILFKNITLTGTEPENEAVRAATIIDGSDTGSVVKFSGAEDDSFLLTGFTIQNGSANNGGGICGDGTNARIISNNVINNSAKYFGGGLYSCNGIIQNNYVAHNRSNEFGGGLMVCKNILNNSISSNYAVKNGGGIYQCNNAVISGNKISNNTAVDQGGGLANCGPNISNNLIFENSASFGGGIASCSGLFFNTIYGNSASASSGGAYNIDDNYNTILWANTAPLYPQTNESHHFDYSCIQDYTGSDSDIMSDDPHFINPEAGDFHLQPDSPCLDFGTNITDALQSIDIFEDLDGNIRPNGGGYDIGCYEWSGCIESILPYEQTISSSGGTLSYQIVAGVSCSWTTVNDSPEWVTVTSGDTGTGNGTVELSIAENTLGPRKAVIKLESAAFTIFQEGADCYFSLDLYEIDLPYTAYGGIINVSTGYWCDWSAISSDESWLTIISGDSGTGDAEFIYQATRNNGDPRTGTITIESETFTVNQTGACNFTLSSYNEVFTKEGGPESVDIFTGDWCAWTAETTDAWITISSPDTGTGDGSISFTVAANPGTPRSGTIQIENQIHTIQQDGDSIPPDFDGDLRLTPMDESILAEWPAAYDETMPINYNIYYSETSGGQNYDAPQASTDGLTYLIPGLTNDTAYYVVVRAEDGAGNETAIVNESSCTPIKDNSAALFIEGDFESSLAGPGKPEGWSYSGQEFGEKTSCFFTDDLAPYEGDKCALIETSGTPANPDDLSIASLTCDDSIELQKDHTYLISMAVRRSDSQRCRLVLFSAGYSLIKSEAYDSLDDKVGDSGWKKLFFYFRAHNYIENAFLKIDNIVSNKRTESGKICRIWVDDVQITDLGEESYIDIYNVTPPAPQLGIRNRYFEMGVDTEISVKEGGTYTCMQMPCRWNIAMAVDKNSNDDLIYPIWGQEVPDLMNLSGDAAFVRTKARDSSAPAWPAIAADGVRINTAMNNGQRHVLNFCYGTRGTIRPLLRVFMIKPDFSRHASLYVDPIVGIPGNKMWPLSLHYTPDFGDGIILIRFDNVTIGPSGSGPHTEETTIYIDNVSVNVVAP